MKFLILFLLLVSQSALACDVQDLRKEVLAQFEKGMPMENYLGDQRAKTNIKDIQVTDSLMNIRGESLFMSKLVFNILWANGVKEEKEILMAAVVDLATCKLEKFEDGEVLGSSISSR